MIDSFSHIPRPTVQYCVISIDDVTEVDVYIFNYARYTNQLETANKQRIKVISSKWIYKTSLSATVT